jgi:hypothetical protein
MRFSEDEDSGAEVMVPAIGRRRQLYVPDRRKIREVKFRDGETHRIRVQDGGPCSHWSLPGGAGMHSRLESRSIRPDGTVRSSYVNWYSARGPAIERQAERKRHGPPALFELGAMTPAMRQAKRRALSRGVPFVVEQYLQKDWNR